MSRIPSCKATIKTLKEVKEMSTSEKEQKWLDLPMEVKDAFLAVTMVMSKPNSEENNVDDWECDLDDIMYKHLLK